MKKIILGIVLSVTSLIAADGRALASKCAACHGAEFEKMALGKSAVVNGQSASDIYAKLLAYKEGRRNTVGMGALMKGQVAAMSNNDIWAVATYIESLSNSSAPQAASVSDWPFVCESSELDFARDDRYFKVGASANGSFPFIGADAQTMQIDRKNKTIKVWTIWLASEEKRQGTIGTMGKYADYSNYGYTKDLIIINYANMKLKRLSATDYNCDGSVIYTLEGSQKWHDIAPNSVLEGITENILKKYKLK